MIVGSLTRQQVQRALENVTIINFNYDRSFDHYLYASIQSLGIGPDPAKEIIARGKFIRPYGSLGSLPWQDRQSVAFGEEYPDLWKLAGGIRTYTERSDNESVVADIKAEMKRAAVAVFLGFGFHKQNVDMLQVADGFQQPAVFVTGCGIDEKNYPPIKARLRAMFQAMDISSFDIENMTCDQLFTKRRQSIGFALG